MKQYKEICKAAINATTFLSNTTFSWFGTSSQELPLEIEKSLTPQTSREYLLYTLQNTLYRWFYCWGTAVNPRQENNLPEDIDQSLLIQKLSDYNCGQGYLQQGWEICSVDIEQVILKKENLKILVHPNDCFNQNNISLIPGNLTRLLLPKESFSISPGFYTAMSNHELTKDDFQNLLRIYWNLSTEGSIVFIKTATSILNRNLIPFIIKIACNSSGIDRCDSTVLYLGKKYYDRAFENLNIIYSEVFNDLSKSTPVFTKVLAEGVGLAEDPVTGESFGQHRCRLLAEALFTAHENEKHCPIQKLELIEQRFKDEGLNLDIPYLNLGSVDIYEKFKLNQLLFNLPKKKEGNYSITESNLFLEAALQIGLRLNQEAVWHNSRCTWLGPTSYITRGHYHSSHKTLGPDLYSGTSGVALFLAELYVVTRNNIFRCAALGAIRQALSRLDLIPSPVRLGIFTGLTGVALTAAHIGIVLREDEILERSAQIIQQIFDQDIEQSEFDLLSGKAGAILALLILHKIHGNLDFLGLAIKLGQNLLDTANISELGYSWKSKLYPSFQNLTGYSHGASGVGQALLELFHVTNNSDFRKGAEEAFRYERQYFDLEVGNWLDFRKQSVRGYNQALFPKTYTTHWCHGAPGIALSRLRAYIILNEKLYLSEATTAIDTTRKAIETSLKSGLGNYSLCHGLVGNSEVLRLCYSWGIYSSQDCNKIWVDVANVGIEKYLKHNKPWPCGFGCTESPSLMVGTAGIGYFYLSLHNPSLPYILCPYIGNGMCGI